jgi:3-oxoadipate enol-lactonase
VPLSSIAHTISALKPRESIVGRLGEIDLPALVIVGKEDHPLPLSCSQEIAVGLKNASLLVVENCGHLSSLEQPEAVTSAMLSFLEELQD